MAVSYNFSQNASNLVAFKLAPVGVAATGSAIQSGDGADIVVATTSTVQTVGQLFSSVVERAAPLAIAAAIANDIRHWNTDVKELGAPSDVTLASLASSTTAAITVAAQTAAATGIVTVATPILVLGLVSSAALAVYSIGLERDTAIYDSYSQAIDDALNALGEISSDVGDGLQALTKNLIDAMSMVGEDASAFLDEETAPIGLRRQPPARLRARSALGMVK